MSLRFSLLAGAALVLSPLAAAQSLTATGPVPAPVADSFGGVVLYDQSDDFGSGIVSQTNISTPTFDTVNADDFVVPDGASWIVTTVVAGGFYSSDSETAPACTSADIGFWSPGNAEPDTPLFLYEDTAVVSDAEGVLEFSIAETTLASGTYWLSIACEGDLNFDTGTPDIRRWNWFRNDNEDATGSIGDSGVLRNDGGAFGLPAGWNPLSGIVADGFDLNFVLSGVISTASTEGPLGASVSIGSAIPNPSSSSARVPFSIEAASDVTLAVYDVLGRQVAVLAQGAYGPGSHDAVLDASALSAGTYVARLQAGSTVVTRTLSIAR